MKVTIGTNTTDTDADTITVDVIDAIRLGHLDDDLDRIIKACEDRKFHTEPWDVLSALTDCAQQVRHMPANATAEQKANLGAEINGRLKAIAADIQRRNEPFLLSLFQKARADVFVKCIGIPRENLPNLSADVRA